MRKSNSAPKASTRLAIDRIGPPAFVTWEIVAGENQHDLSTRRAD